MSVRLLHVVSLNIFPSDNRVYQELGREASWYLRRLCNYLDPGVSTRRRVRMGRVDEEIMAEVKAEEPDIVVLSTRQSSSPTERKSFWRLRADRRVQTTGLKLVAETDCNLVILPARSSFDCESVWGRPTTSDLQHLSPDNRRADSLQVASSCPASSAIGTIETIPAAVV